MSFRDLINKEKFGQAYLPGILKFAPSRLTGSFIVAVIFLVEAGFMLVWWKPSLIFYGAGEVFLITVLVVWWQWAGSKYMAAWASTSIILVLFWFSMFILWLFIETIPYRILIMLTVAYFSWWYINEWKYARQRLLFDSQHVSSVANMVLGFITVFSLVAAAEGLLVFADIPLWPLLTIFYLAMVISVLALIKANGWSLVERWRYLATAAVILFEALLVVMWWPTSFYVIGFTVAIVYLIIALSLRQEAQGFLNRRVYSIELISLGLVLGLALLTARWI